MRQRRVRRGTRAVRPEDMADVEQEKEEQEEDEEKMGEEPGEVEAPLDRRVRGRKKEEDEEEEPRRIAGGEGGGAKMRNIGDPRLPTQKEVDEHNLTHVPYRNWCPHCVKGRGKDLDHRRNVDEDHRVKEFSFDYCFPGDDQGKKITILVGRERVSGMVMASVVPVKGTSGQFAAMRVMSFIRECGAAEADIILKSDQEPAIETLIRDVATSRGARLTMMEQSPVGSSGSNGGVERAVQSVEGQLRTLKSACEARLGTPIRPEERITTFMAEYAAYLLNRLEVGKTVARRMIVRGASELQYWRWNSEKKYCGRFDPRPRWKS